ncbi:hypothetical protein [Pseudonocardia phyllosphaerae]|uniref:hypothetical protein n=1 Tax=Pseudonocardia phyllosphaerae TaxID=3390502 RepID=UPI00397E5E66
MPNRFTIPGLKRPSLSGWPLVGILGVGLALVALVYGSATDNLESSCTMTVQQSQVTVRVAPNSASRAVETLNRGEDVGAETIVDSGFRKLTGGDRWVPANSVAATAGSTC